MTGDERPRPEYGEYASESERASAIERSGATRPAEPVPPAGPVPAMPVPATPARTGNPRQKSGTPSTSATLGARTASSAADRIVTISLLSFGLVYVLGGAESYFTLEASMGRMFGQLGIGDYTPTTLTPIIGILIVVSQGITWLIAAGWSYGRIRRGRMAWWIPVAGGIVSFIASVALLGILLGADPAFLSFVSSA